ncbi:MAG: hypothetical protein LBC10_05180 [Deltaproteobacteria bacterium]|jgi:hypothetical protein|nr:hypothetical protein [Deltaproteobacteria bacterium]
MLNSALFIFVLLLVLTIVIRRFFSRERRGGLDTYIHQREQEAHSRIESMRLETHRFDTHEALAPVEAGLRELLDLHGNPADIALEREDDTLILRSPDTRIAIAWNFRSASRATPARSGHVYGKGQWELRVRDGHPEPYTQLGSLMGRLSPLVRALAAHVPPEDFAPDDPFFPGCRQDKIFQAHPSWSELSESPRPDPSLEDPPT